MVPAELLGHLHRLSPVRRLPGIRPARDRRRGEPLPAPVADRAQGDRAGREAVDGRAVTGPTQAAGAADRAAGRPADLSVRRVGRRPGAAVPRGVLQGTASRSQAAWEDRHRDHPRRSVLRFRRPARQARLRPDSDGEVMGALLSVTAAPEGVGESLDPRDPLLRLSTFFDDGSVELLHERDCSGVLAAAGTVDGTRTIAFCTDGTVMGGAMGVEGCAHIVDAYDTAIEEQSPIVGIWH